MQIKYKNKVRLAKYIKEHNGIEVDPSSIFDVQVKTTYMSIRDSYLNILTCYVSCTIRLRAESGLWIWYPRTFIFGAKAAAGYQRLQSQTIKLINNVS